jgi:hypothetical protein
MVHRALLGTSSSFAVLSLRWACAPGWQVVAGDCLQCGWAPGGQQVCGLWLGGPVHTRPWFCTCLHLSAGVVAGKHRPYHIHGAPSRS